MKELQEMSTADLWALLSFIKSGERFNGNPPKLTEDEIENEIELRIVKLNNALNLSK